MDIVDVNVLIYAVNRSEQRHAGAKEWLGAAMGGAAEPVGLSWHSLLGFLRLTTRPGILTRPLAPEEALDIVDDWLAAPASVVIHPTARHAHHVRRLVAAAGRAGNLVGDAHLAALALEHSAEIVSYDGDFRRFPGVRWRMPG